MEWGGHKIGLIGLVEKEWLETLATINPEEVSYIFTFLALPNMR
jgi:5'-nucleotidase